MKRFFSKSLTFAAFIHFFLTLALQIDRAFFTYDEINVFYLLVKAVYLIILIFLYNLPFHAKIFQQKEPVQYKRFINIFVVHFCISCVLMLAFWPGLWTYDDVRVLLALRLYNVQAWQHFLTSFIQAIFLQLLPFPGGIIIIQNALISSFIAYIIIKIETTYHVDIFLNTFFDYTAKLVPFFMPPIVFYQYSGYRMGLYTYLEALLVCILICNVIQKQKASFLQLFFIIMLASIVATWRTESFVYLFPTVAVIFYQRISFTRKCASSCILILIFISFSLIQDTLLTTKNYSLMSTVRQCTVAVRNSDPIADAELLKAINPVFPLRLIYENPKQNGETLFYSALSRRKYTDNQFKEYCKALLLLTIRHPQPIIKERINVFLGAINLKGYTVTQLKQTKYLFHPDAFIPKHDWLIRAFNEFKNQNWLANRPLSPTLRFFSINFLGQIGKNGNYTTLFKVLWGASIPIIAIIIALLYSLIKKHWYISFIFLCVLIKNIIIIATEPASYIMYFVPTCLVGYIIVVWFLIIYFYHRIGNQYV